MITLRIRYTIEARKRPDFERYARTITKIVSPDQQVFEMYDKAPGAKEMKVMEITYDRMK